MRIRLLFRLSMMLPALVLQVFAEPMTVIRDIRNLPPEKAAQELPVEICGLVSSLHPRKPGMFIFDGENGIYVTLPKNAGEIEGLRFANKIRIIGKTGKGNFLPTVTAESIEVLSTEALPDPLVFNWKHLHDPSVDCQWFKVGGWMTGLYIQEELDYVVAELDVYDSTILVLFPNDPGMFERVKKHMFHYVIINGVAGTLYNTHRQMLGRYIFTHAATSIYPEKAGKKHHSKQLIPLQEIYRYGANRQIPLHTFGTVIHATQDTIYLRNEHTTLKAKAMSDIELYPGDEVELTGYIRPNLIAPEFGAYEVRRTGHGAIPEPKRIETKPYYYPVGLHNELVQLDAVTVGLANSLSPRNPPENKPDSMHETLLCRKDDWFFNVQLPEGEVIKNALSPGTTIRITGICKFSRNHDRLFFREPALISLTPRSMADITVLKPAPWWTPKRLFWGLGTALFFLLGYQIWVTLLRKRVITQTQTITSQIKRESILNERQRIARELHDTLEQALTGLSMLLGNSKLQLKSNIEKGRHSLELAESMLKYCREESRSTINDLRGGILEKTDLPSAIRKTIAPLIEECGAKLSFSCTGTPCRLTLSAERHILRITSEAITNAARHGAPQHISVSMLFEQNYLNVKITDDGCGFDTNILTSSTRFGIQGLHERANHVGGFIEIQSAPGKGTSVELNIPALEKLKRKEV
ncbi:sensor histidine kinase [Pontiella agarivorans]|uniref:Sensor histidine kinase n=1 Tax=Pontiella agarivorans TaxID=3038953 RepID=A0ABU5MY62_9BACT|nr:sensor histidine kinase [Pontiella agarivorans]MDZ8119137.1 sensor histidine kinase [Pontiella agarivorans]